MEGIIPDFSTADVLVIGDVMLDKYWHGSTSRISPEAPVPVVHVGNEEYRAGGAGNVAVNIAQLGANVSLMGLAGKDLAANELESLLKNAEVNSLISRVESHPTITKLRIISRQQQLIRLDFEDSFNIGDCRLLTKNFEDTIKNEQVIILSDYGKGALSNSQELIKIAQNSGCKILVDPKGSDFSKYCGATIITPNLSEFETVVGKCANDDEIISKGKALIDKIKLQALLVTRGEQGMTLIQRDGSFINMPTHAKEVYDVTGAGDTVISVLATSLAAGKSLEDSVRLANIAAGIVVGKLGTATVSVSELTCTAHAISTPDIKITKETHLKLLVEAAKNRGEKIVMTNGCFDIIHAGHVDYLQNAAKLGDRLIIAVNDDASVKRLKGDSRPVNNIDNRMTVLAALGAVDWVVPFSEDTPERLISEILPDILVKGGDYKPSEIAGGKQVIKNGGKIEIISFVDGCSTTNIINKIKE
ncbi:MAG: bifunctional D-glycero-beta-D-manno-heptose-7-phosphate kinase/D-glycero-beta-D-manno-heptose 1-phosphate adenylyltransferase HldE [Gammaproteobacteria bacterium]|nr:MAG: bifunctional D-glycero-beta-D-manno-heptose-7-phosphate kinase/D-glycero-beta-D-manno-heptose 1-phosphate adenylyltransferase HldE [Gammaproteobacteria bacterium]